MSTHQSGLLTEDLDDETVREFLTDHPDFFERHPDILSQLSVRHPQTGSAVSLVEKQVQVLRQRNRKLERQLKSLVDVARQNDKVVERIHQLALKLVRSRTLPGVSVVIEASLREDFGADAARMVLFKRAPDTTDVRGSFIKRVDRDASEMSCFENFFAMSKPRAGRLSSEQCKVLFGELVQMLSAALVPLGANAELGLLAIGSEDAERFNPTMSTEFLARIGDLVAQAVGDG